MKRSERGQTIAEYAVVVPLLALLFYGVYLAAMYAYRAGQADYGVFVSGVASGAYRQPAGEIAKKAVTSPDLRSAIKTGVDGGDPRTTFTARSRITVETSRLTFMGVNFIEAQKGQSIFRLWRFRPGKPLTQWE